MPHYTHVLGWLVGLEGVALLRAQAGDPLGSSREFVQARLDEVRAMLADPDLSARPGGMVGDIGTRDGYAQWVHSYDDPGNPLIAAEEPVVRPLLDALKLGRVLDAACGTGRHSHYLAELGHEVVGVDSSPEMLARARAKVPAGEFREAALDELPFPDGSFDSLVCTLALTYQPRLEPTLAEFARVLRPGGQMILSDIHWLSLYLGGVSSIDGPDGRLAMPASRFLPSDYLRVAIASGFTVRACHEPRWGDVPGGHGGSDAQRYCPEAVRVACRDTPALIVWHLERAA
ncbi:class I SAM-dependent methyltransferase [Actinopolymorpha singaporensis]|uniref:Methyltransferase domain-containing protein n=1 Tax=Actinopolymorpha singaporensis TaxID=117157 RepID=A0A1H1RRA2_9ACTN|nr:class I SAM-dependent methyltransferase [Actinopolymorpha singaporensis]SDS38265.1 Methyltransferase domain-containing protein [Actinopolymorpha singaporensis]